MKRIITVFVSLVIVCSLVACSPTSTPSTTESDTETSAEANNEVASDSSGNNGSSDIAKEITMGIAYDPGSWAPWAGFNPGRRDTIPMLYQALTADVMDPETNKMTTYNVMITGYEMISEDTYELHLREGIYDTDGNPFTASDAIFCFEQLLSAGTDSSVGIIDHLNFIDDYTFQIVIGDALNIGEFENVLTGTYMVTQAAYEAAEDGMISAPVGTTGYVLSDYVAGSGCTFTKSELGYWNDDANQSESIEDGYCFMYDTKNVDIVNYKFITDTSTMAVALETGAIDVAAGVTADDVKLFDEGGQDADKFDVSTYADTQYLLSFNCSDDSVCSNINLRKAISYCFDSQGILDASYDGDGQISHAWAYPAMKDYQAEWDEEDYFGYNEETAESYLQAYYDETGTTADDLHIRLLIYNKAAVVQMAQALQAYIGTLVGDPNCCELLEYDSNTYNEMREDPTAFDIHICYAINSRTYPIDTWYEACTDISTGDHNQFFVDDPTLLELITAASSTSTHSDETVASFQEYINEQCYIVGMVTGNVYIVGANWIENCMIGIANSVSLCGMEYDWDAKSTW